MIIKRWNGQEKLEVGIMGVVINLSNYKKEKEMLKKLIDIKIEEDIKLTESLFYDDDEYINSFLKKEELKEM